MNIKQNTIQWRKQICFKCQYLELCSLLPPDLFHWMDTSPFLHSLLIGIWTGFWLWDISNEGAMNNSEQTFSQCVPIYWVTIQSAMVRPNQDSTCVFNLCWRRRKMKIVCTRKLSGYILYLNPSSDDIKISTFTKLYILNMCHWLHELNVNI